jgi:hypothetical protein
MINRRWTPMDADKTLIVGGFGSGSGFPNQTRLAFAFIGVHRRSSAVPMLLP